MGSKSQPIHGDPGSHLLERTNAADKARTLQAQSPRPTRAKEYLCRFFIQRQAYLRQLLAFVFARRRPGRYACGNPVRHGTSTLQSPTYNCSNVFQKQIACSYLHRSSSVSLTEAQGQRQPSVTAATFLFAEAPGLSRVSGCKYRRRSTVSHPRRRQDNDMASNEEASTFSLSDNRGLR